MFDQDMTHLFLPEGRFSTNHRSFPMSEYEKDFVKHNNQYSMLNVEKTCKSTNTDVLRCLRTITSLAAKASTHNTVSVVSNG